MTADNEPHRHRPPPARPVRVARFDGFPSDGHASDPSADGRRVAGLDELDHTGRSPGRVAALDTVDARPAPSAAVAALSTALDAGDVTSPPPASVAALGTVTGPQRGKGAGRRGAAGPAHGASSSGARPSRAGVSGAGSSGADPSGVGSSGVDPSGADLSGADPSGAVDVPPDGPLPRGRRRRARVGRLGPDAPDPDEPQPEADPVAVAREICLRLLTERARTRQELAQTLARKAVPADAAAAVLDRFDEVGLIDDAAFAGQWVRSRHTQRGLGRRAIAVELRRKGVADDVAGEALAEVDAEAEARRARELVDRKLRSLTVDTAEQRTAAARRLVGMLARKGYGAATAYQVVREALAESGADVDELGAEPAD